MTVLSSVKLPLPQLVLGYSIICLAQACTNAESDDLQSDDIVDVDETREALSGTYPRCGDDSHNFPTWAGWGTTHVEFNNLDSGGTTIHLEYHAGAGDSVRVDVRDRYYTEGQWWGAWLWVTYLGWSDRSGYHPCRFGEPNAGSPALYTNTW